MEIVKEKVQKLEDDIKIINNLRIRGEELKEEINNIRDKYQEMVEETIKNANGLANVFNYDIGTYYTHGHGHSLLESEAMIDDFTDLLNHLHKFVLNEDLKSNLAVNQTDKKVVKI